MLDFSERQALSVLVSRWAAVAIVLLGASVLVGWWQGIPVLKSLRPDLVSMKANTAVSFMAAGMALLLLGGVRVDAPTRHFGRAMAGLVFLVGALTLAQYAFDLNLGIDEMLFADDGQAATTSHPGRMALMTATCFVLAALALMQLDHNRRLSRWIAMSVLVLATLGVIGYMFGVQSLYRVSIYTSMAAHTAAGFIVLALGIIAARPFDGCMQVILGDSLGGIVARRLLWIIPGLLFLLGWLSHLGQGAGLYDDHFGLAAMVVAGMALSAVLIMSVASLLHAMDARRQEAQTSLAALNASLEQTVSDRTRMLQESNRRLGEEVEERKRAEEAVRQLSLTDELTGLLNRRGFMLLAEQNLKTGRRTRDAHALIFVDLDGLKAVNDTLGHEAGDAMIVDAAQLLRSCFRDADIVARLGGDEFAILAANGERTDVMLGRMEAALARIQGDSGTRRLSFSVGVAIADPAEGKDLKALLAEADAAMYRQKEARRPQR